MRPNNVRCILASSCSLFVLAALGCGPAGTPSVEAGASRRTGTMTTTVSNSGVTASGTVRIGRRALPRMPRLTFRATSGRDRVDAQVDSQGHFQATLPSPGQYLVEVRFLRYLAVSSGQVSLEPGVNRFDVDLPDTHMRLELAGVTPVQPVQLHLISEFGTTYSEIFAGIVLPADGHTIDLYGYAPGVYLVAADTADEQVSLEAARMDLQVGQRSDGVLRFGRQPLRVEVRDTRGAVVPGAEITAGAKVASPTAPGVFSLPRVSSGTPFWVTAPGYVPVCKLAATRGEQPVAVRLEKASGSVSLELAGNSAGTTGTIGGLPSSDCDVPLNYFDVSWQRSKPAVLVSVNNLPGGRLFYRPVGSDEKSIFSVPASGVVTVQSNSIQCGTSRYTVSHEGGGTAHGVGTVPIH